MEPADFDQILRTVRSFIRDEVLPLEADIEEKDEIPEALRAMTADLGLFGYALPEEYGGLEFSMHEDARLAFELGYVSPAFRSMIGTNNGIAGQVIVNYGSDEQKSRILPALASGELVASFALTEPEAGSDPSGMRTTARRTDSGYVLNGQKRFITNAAQADLFIVFARTSDAAGAAGVTAFAVPRDTPGLVIGPKDIKMGQRGSNIAELFFDDAHIDAATLIGDEGHGFTAAMRSLARGRLNIAGCCVGLAQRLLDESVAYAQTARQGGEPIGRFQLVQAMIADTHTELAAARALVLATARSYDEGNDQRTGPSVAKLFCSEMVGRAADRAVQIHGGMGYINSVPVERFYRDARLYRIYEGTSEVQRVKIGSTLLAGAAS